MLWSLAESHLMAGPIPNSRWPTQNVLKGNFEDCLPLIALFEPFFSFVSPY